MKSLYLIIYALGIVLSFSACQNTVQLDANVTSNIVEDKSKPTIPSDFNAEVMQDKSIFLSWSPSTDDVKVASYLLYRDGQLLKSINQINYTDTNALEPNVYKYSIVAVDTSNNSSDEAFVSISTTTLNHAPTIVSPTIDMIKAGTAKSYPIEARDMENSPLIYSLLLEPSWLSINENGILLASPSVNIEGTFSFIIKVSDGELSSQINTSIKVEKKVEDTLSPAITLVSIRLTSSDIKINVGERLTLSIMGTYSDNHVAELNESVQWNQTNTIVSFSNTTLIALKEGETIISASVDTLLTQSLHVSVLKPIEIDENNISNEDNSTINPIAPVDEENNCTLLINPSNDFVEAFSKLSAGDTLCLDDGVYTQAMDIPSYIHVKALHTSKAEIDGEDTLGEAWSGGLVQMKGVGSSVQGLKVYHAGYSINTCHVGGENNIMRDMSCSHAGAHKHKIPIYISGSGHTIEDSWAYGKGRYVIQCFKGRNIKILRNVVRWDITTENTPSEPNAGIAIYNCLDITISNNISLDYAYSNQYMKFGADIYSPQNCTVWPEGNNNNYYLGNYVINHALGNANRKGLRLEADCTAKNNVVKDLIVDGSDYGIVISNKESNLSLSNCSFSNIDIKNISAGGENKNITCEGDAEFGAKYIDRIKVSNTLFPFKNEALIKLDMCDENERQSQWCTTSDSLSEYVKKALNL